MVPDTVPTDASWQHHVAYVGIPPIASAVVAKEVQTVHPSARIRSGKGFKTEIDNYIRFSPYPVMAALNLAGYHGRSDWARLGVQTLAANAVMAVAVEATKQAVHQTRPDATDRRSFPSGHTATAFVAATMLHKEYGETRSPWFSVGGYAVASATALMRVLHHRHSAADVMAGAGIGILSTEIGYFLTELCMKHKGERQFDAHIASGVLEHICHHQLHKSHPVLEAASELVAAAVGVGREELADEGAVTAVDLNAVKASLAGEVYGRSEVLYQRQDFVLLKGPGPGGGVEVEAAGGSDRGAAAGRAVGHITAVAQLD